MKRALSEREFLRQVIDLARLLGWRCAHFRPARTRRGWRTPCEGDGAGYPDLTLARGGRVIWAELKVGNNGCSPAQRAWLADLPAGCAFVWYPKDFAEIERLLRGG